MPSMLAALYDGISSMEVREIQQPSVGPDDALIQVRSEGICGSDLNLLRKLTEPETLPAGHETAGEVVEVGANVDSTLVGKRVAAEVVGHGRACLVCYYCRIGEYRNCIDKSDDYPGGGFAEYVVRKAVACYPLDTSLTWKDGALVEPLAVSIHAMRRSSLKGGETVVVLGAGNIGLTTIAAARAMGAGTIIATARHPHQSQMARRLGADIALHPDDPELVDNLADLTHGLGSDITFETVGGFSGETLDQSIELTRIGGRIVLLGVFHEPVTTNWFDVLMKEQSIITSTCYSIATGRHDFESAIDLLSSGRIDLKQMVTHNYPLVEAKQAFETAFDKTSGSIKVQINP